MHKHKTRDQKGLRTLQMPSKQIDTPSGVIPLAPLAEIHDILSHALDRTAETTLIPRSGSSINLAHIN